MINFIRLFAVSLLIIIAVYVLLAFSASESAVPEDSPVTESVPMVNGRPDPRYIIRNFVACEPGERAPSRELAPGVTKWRCGDAQ